MSEPTFDLDQLDNLDFERPAVDASERIDLDALDLLEISSTAAPVHALKPRTAKAVHQLVQRGQKARKAGRWVEAAKLINEAWGYEPDNVSLVKALADCVGNIGARSKAIELYLYAHERDPRDAEIPALAGQLALDMEMWEQADKLNGVFIELDPLNPMGYVNRATALRKLERFDEAIDMLQQVLPLIPEDSDLWNVLGSVVNMRDGLDVAMPFYTEALRLDPKAYKTHNNVARALNDLGRYEEAVPYAKKAVKHSGAMDQVVRMGLAMAQLGAGHLPDAWENYAVRLDKRRQDAIRYALEVPYLGDQPLAGKNIFVVPEQGVGDEILFLSALPDLIEQAASVTVGCDARLVSLVQRSFPALKGVHAYTDRWKEGYRIRCFDDLKDYGRGHDGYVVMGDLFAQYRRDVSHFETAGQAFLNPNADKVSAYKNWLSQHGSEPKIGICWRSGLRKAERNFWYADLEKWAPIFAVQGVTFVNLQYGDCDDEIADFKARFGVNILRHPDIDLKDDLDDAAALTKALDGVVTIGAQPGMSAYAVDQQIFWLFPFPPWWNFGTRTSAPMHPRSKLFIGDTPMDWESAMSKAAAALSKFAKV